jgi:hypothetical protein
MSQNWTPPPPPAGAPGAAPSNYLVPAILVTLFCCLPGGVVAIIYATQVNSKVAAGDLAGAKSAKMWVMISAGVGVALILIYIVVMFVFGGLAAIGGR